jgi:hypothetical protein
MGIEPTGNALPSLLNKRFGANADAKCDWRVNFGGMWGNAGTRETTVVTSEAPSGIAGRRAVYMSIRQLSTMLRPSVFASPGP